MRNGLPEAESVPAWGETTFAGTLARALQRLDVDRRLSAALARELRQTIAATNAGERACLAFEPEKHLGPFESLPSAAHDAIIEAIADRERSEFRGYELGRWYWALLRSLWRLKHAAHRLKPTKLARLVQECADVIAYGARKAPAFAISVFRERLAVRGRFSSRPKLTDVLRLARVDPRDLAVCYARRVPQVDQYRGYWHDRSRHITVGRVLGIDLLPAAEGWWFVESNAHPDMTDRSELYERDPMPADIARCTGPRRLPISYTWMPRAPCKSSSVAMPPRQLTGRGTMRHQQIDLQTSEATSRSSPPLVSALPLRLCKLHLRNF